MMNRDESTDINAAELVSHVRALIERSSLGEEGPRLLRGRASDTQLERIRQLRQRDTDINVGPSEALARRLIAEAMGTARLPRRTPAPGHLAVTSGPLAAARRVEYPDPAYSGSYRNDSHTMTRVAAGLRGSASCPT